MMSVYDMVDDVCRKFGFEAEETIEFCRMADAVVSESDREMLSGRWFVLMSMSVMVDEDEDDDLDLDDEDDDEYYDDYDECGFNPYMGCYDYDC